MYNFRSIAAFIVAPLTPALIFIIPAMFSGAPQASLGSIFVLVCAVTYAHAFVLGLPLALLIQEFSSFSWLCVVVAAFLIGALPFGSFMLYQAATLPPGSGYTSNDEVLEENGHVTTAGIRSDVLGVLSVGGLGAISGLVWWLIARPEKKAPKQ
jgi:hypothetical protein